MCSGKALSLFYSSLDFFPLEFIALFLSECIAAATTVNFYLAAIYLFLFSLSGNLFEWTRKRKGFFLIFPSPFLLVLQNWSSAFWDLSFSFPPAIVSISFFSPFRLLVGYFFLLSASIIWNPMKYNRQMKWAALERMLSFPDSDCFYLFFALWICLCQTTVSCHLLTFLCFNGCVRLKKCFDFLISSILKQTIFVNVYICI